MVKIVIQLIWVWFRPIQDEFVEERPAYPHGGQLRLQRLRVLEAQLHPGQVLIKFIYNRAGQVTMRTFVSKQVFDLLMVFVFIKMQTFNFPSQVRDVFSAAL